MHSIVLSLSGLQGGFSLSQLSFCNRQGTPWTGRQSIAGLTQRDKQPFTLTPMGNLELPIKLTPLTPCLWTVREQTDRQKDRGPMAEFNSGTSYTCKEYKPDTFFFSFFCELKKKCFFFFLRQSADMSAASSLRSEDQFLCSVCLDVFTDPVSIPCGHNFCKNCITEYWDINKRCQCPMCNETFNTRPHLRVNTFISEVTHLEPHLTKKGLKRHQLIDAVENLEGRMCKKYDKPLELFCKTDQTCVCARCSISDHKNHEFVPLKDEYEGKKAELEKTEAEIQQMIQKRRLKIQQIKESVKMSKGDADRQKAEGVQVFTALKKSVDRGLKELIKEIEDKQETKEKHAEGLIKDLEQEISELKKRRSELEETLRKLMKKKLFEAELKRVQQYAVDVTLDLDTANSKLILSDDEKQVHCGDVRKKLPDNPERFSPCPNVLGKQSFSSGRFYFEVQVKGKTAWTLGVARESINRKGKIPLCPQDGFWTVWLRNGNEYRALAGPPVPLCLQSGPEMIGVFVDYEEGLVSFYDVDFITNIITFILLFFYSHLSSLDSEPLHV
uniref:Tripartite motif containing 39 n=1 Tax=Maylandia zebra TaxID=106582 RepID=A0A3P9DAV5_9CICH